MATTRPLFDIPLEKRREAFVRARFAQDDVFGMYDVETWLTLQRTLGRPDVERWPKFLTHDFLAMCAGTNLRTHLIERATPIARVTCGTVDRSVYAPIYSLFGDDLYSGHLYYSVYAPSNPDAGDALFVISGSNDNAIKLERIGDPNLHVGARAVVDVLFAEWDRQRPKWNAAREFLYDALAEDIKRERAKAERDFDTAVAVSADGTKIVHADYVVVIVEHGRRCRELIAYPATTFTERKLIRLSRMQRTTPFKLVSDKTGGDDDLTAISKSLGYQNDWPCDEWRRRLGDIVPFTSISIQELRGYRQDGEHRILLTTPNLCPSPLPDGGVEVMV